MTCPYHSHPVGPVLRARRRTIAVALGLVLAAGSVGVAAAERSPASAPPGTEPTATGANPAGCVDDAEPGTELFPDQFTVQHAENFTITYESNYKVLTVGETSPAAGSRSYVLVQCGTEAPALEGDLDGATVVEIPVSSMFSESTSHVGFIDVLDLEGIVTGVSDESWIATPSLREHIDAGDIESFNTTGVIDTEVIVAADPGVYVTGGFDDPAHEAIAEADIPVVANAEWLEKTPAGWAEWVGVFAALTNTEALANELYGQWIADYEAAAELVEGVTDRPTVITGGLYEGTWFSNGGDSISAEFIADAGGDYVYDDDAATGSIELDIESALADGATADVWLLANGFTTRAEAIAADARNAEFDAWEGGGVWINSVPVDPSVNPFEQGPVMIDEYLLDYIKILHPELAPDHELVFFSAVPESSGAPGS